MKKYETYLSKKYKGKIKVKDLIHELKECGYDTVFFNTQKGDDLLALYNIDPGAASSFTYRDTVGIVFVDNKLSESDKLCVMLHELGHIKLGHLDADVAKHRDDKILELEADTFAHSVLCPKKTSAVHKLIAVLMSTFVFVLGGACGTFFINTAHQSTVCITQQGEKFHRQSCIYAKDKAIAELSRSEALKCFEPCKVCNP